MLSTLFLHCISFLVAQNGTLYTTYHPSFLPCIQSLFLFCCHSKDTRSSVLPNATPTPAATLATLFPLPALNIIVPIAPPRAAPTAPCMRPSFKWGAADSSNDAIIVLVSGTAGRLIFWNIDLHLFNIEFSVAPWFSEFDLSEGAE